MGVPKRRTSKMRIRMRKATHKVPLMKAAEGKDGTVSLPHRVNPTTGRYNGRQVLTISDEA